MLNRLLITLSKPHFSLTMLRCSIVRALRPGLPVVRCGPIKSPYLAAQGLQRNYSNQTTPRQPVPLSGALRSLGLKHIEVKPALGTEFQECSLMEIMSAPNSDELVRDLAVTSMCLRVTGLAGNSFVYFAPPLTCSFEKTKSLVVVL